MCCVFKDTFLLTTVIQCAYMIFCSLLASCCSSDLANQQDVSNRTAILFFFFCVWTIDSIVCVTPRGWVISETPSETKNQCHSQLLRSYFSPYWCLIWTLPAAHDFYLYYFVLCRKWCCNLTGWLDNYMKNNFFFMQTTKHWIKSSATCCK